MKISIIGVGGHAKVVFEALVNSGVKRRDIVLRDRESGNLDDLFEGCRFETPELAADMTAQGFHVAIGNNKVRESLHLQATELGASGYSIIDKNAHVSATAAVGEASFLACGSIVAAKAVIGDGAIVNHNCVVDHDCNIGGFCHIAPGAVLGGGVQVGDRTMIGSGAVVLPGITIGKDVVVGAGSVVTKPVGNSSTWIGTSLAS